MIWREGEMGGEKGQPSRAKVVNKRVTILALTASMLTVALCEPVADGYAQDGGSPGSTGSDSRPVLWVPPGQKASWDPSYSSGQGKAFDASLGSNVGVNGPAKFGEKLKELGVSGGIQWTWEEDRSNTPRAIFSITAGQNTFLLVQGGDDKSSGSGPPVIDTTDSTYGVLKIEIDPQAIIDRSVSGSTTAGPGGDFTIPLQKVFNFSVNASRQNGESYNSSMGQQIFPWVDEAMKREGLLPPVEILVIPGDTLYQAIGGSELKAKPINAPAKEANQTLGQIFNKQGQKYVEIATRVMSANYEYDIDFRRPMKEEQQDALIEKILADIQKEKDALEREWDRKNKAAAFGNLVW